MQMCFSKSRILSLIEFTFRSTTHHTVPGRATNALNETKKKKYFQRNFIGQNLNI